MKDLRTLEERIKLLERELATLTEKNDGLVKTVGEIEELKLDIKALKLFMGRVNPGFKEEFQEIIKKLGSGRP